MDTDITAFYVWIPRYKYRVWNIARQGTTENYYSYSAYSTGVEIEFENGIESTGNVECSYDVLTNGSATYLSDNRKVNGTSVVYGVDNRHYVGENEAWYTHPAFTFGAGTDKQKKVFGLESLKHRELKIQLLVLQIHLQYFRMLPH